MQNLRKFVKMRPANAQAITEANMAEPDGSNATFDKILEGQWFHLGALAALLAGCAWASWLPQIQAGRLWNFTSSDWFWLAIAVAVAQQVYVSLRWRLELHCGALSHSLNGHAFNAFAARFAILGILRVLVVFVLAYANRGTITDESLSLKIAAIVVLVPAVYLFYSVERYFTFRRAFGVDHFDPVLRSVPFVRDEIFRFTANGMYVFGFLLLWFPGLWWASAAALFAALFNHLYIWVHYFATERPDIEYIYNSPRAK
jgi:hypothetical protein